jgi:ubiquinone/menaquinone biosynthesis C-methylase UbiE
LIKWQRSAELFHGEAEHLPFCDETFDVVFHVGGINFFNDRAAAIREMIRVAKPRTKLLIVDETEKGVTDNYERTPFVRRYYQKRSAEVKDPSSLVPREMLDIRTRLLLNDKMYAVTFRKP